ncbi:unnamed protein product [Cylicostephanus goldi]|uniref:JmjC domain-containing protein n=1 Tax=Cylicostephanus goldi TaxID=71465 RepID=A0A3P6SAP1_CYLGO|nr:unnamed protein product [Cylicostephanus goldi]
MGDGVPEQLLQRYAQFCDRHLPVPPAVHENEVTMAVKTLPNSVPIPVLDELSKWDFFDQYFPRQEPVIVKGLNRHWPAVKNWSFNHLHKILCHRVLPVEQGSKYTDSNWAQMLMTGSQFFTTCTLPVDEVRHTLFFCSHFIPFPHLERSPVSRSTSFVPSSTCTSRGHFSSTFDEVDKNCWIGPGGTVSPLHTDPRENIFSQWPLKLWLTWLTTSPLNIVGRKFFRLVSPAESDKVYAFKDGLLTNTSQVDVLNPDLEKYPEFAKAKCWDGVVEGGDVLYIPKGWWHLVVSLTNSIAFAFWFDK